MALERRLLAGSRIHVSNVLATVGWLYMSLLAVALILKGLMGQPKMPWWLYGGAVVAIGLLILGGWLAEAFRGMLMPAGIWLALGVLAEPATRALAWSASNDQWAVMILLIFAIGYAGSNRVKFTDVDANADASAI